MNARLPHVEFFPGARKRVAEASFMLLIAVYRHEIEGIVVLLGSERRVPEWLFLRRFRVARERHAVDEHPHPDALLVSVRQMCADDVADRGDRRPAVGRQAVNVFVGRRGAASHDRERSISELWVLGAILIYRSAAVGD